METINSILNSIVWFVIIILIIEFGVGLVAIILVIGGGIIGWFVGNTGGGSLLGVIGLVVGGFVGLLIGIKAIRSIEDAKRRKEDAERRKWQEKSNKEEQLKQEELERERERKRKEEQLKWNAVNRIRALSNIARLVSDAQLSAAALPLQMSEAELSLDLAEKEFSEGLYSPFWEAMESAAQHLNFFSQTLQIINDAQRQHALEAPPLAPDAVSFSLGVTVLPSPSATNQRMKALYRQAQKDPHFAQIYEQRRTNAILIEGFRSLGEALTYLGDRLESELRSLGDTIDFRLSDLESALRDSSKEMNRQHEALLQSAQLWREDARSGNAELIQIARSNAEQAENDARQRRGYEEATRKMLDNIQHRRKLLL